MDISYRPILLSISPLTTLTKFNHDIHLRDIPVDTVGALSMMIVLVIVMSSWVLYTIATFDFYPELSEQNRKKIDKAEY